MKWYYESNGHPQGPILESELRRLKEEGRISAECLIWREGMEDWVPLEKVREFGSAPRLTKGVGDSRPPSIPEDSDAVSRDEPLDSGPGTAQEATPADVAMEGGAPAQKTAGTDADNGRENHPTAFDCAPKWECPGPGGPLAELLPSTVEILFSPARVFANLRRSGGWGMPLAFLAILNAVGTVMVLWTVEQLPATGSVFSKLIRLTHRQNLSAAMLLATIIGSTLVLPITAVFKTGVLHVLMRLVAGSTAPFSTTFRAACYAMGAASALWIVPLGAVWASSFSRQPAVVEAAMLLSTGATGVWSTVVLLQALARSHEVALWRTVLAILVPPFIASVLFGVALASAVSSS